MSISYQAIIERMKKELETLDEQSTADQFIAKMHVVKSLADVIIESKTSFIESAVDRRSKEADTISDEEAKMMGIKKVSSTNDSNKSHKLNEEDANGDSIFDF